jgi:hypothetical protein
MSEDTIRRSAEEAAVRGLYDTAGVRPADAAATDRRQPRERSVA